MQASYGRARIVERPGKPPVWRVLVGEETGTEDAESIAAQIRGSGTSALVVRLDEIGPEPE
jgi:hypothetical protein